MLVKAAEDAALAGDLEAAGDAVVGLRSEGDDLAFAVYHKAEGHTLHAACRKPAAYLLPEYGRQLEAYQTVQHAPGLLGVHEVHIQLARVVYRVQDGVFGDFMEDDATGLLLRDFERVGKMP